METKKGYLVTQDKINKYHFDISVCRILLFVSKFN